MVKKKAIRETKPSPLHQEKINSFYSWEGDTLILNVLGTPGASKDAIGKIRGNQLRSV
jgi:hypothetical protein